MTVVAPSGPVQGSVSLFNNGKIRKLTNEHCHSGALVGERLNPDNLDWQPIATALIHAGMWTPSGTIDHVS